MLTYSGTGGTGAGDPGGQGCASTVESMISICRDHSTNVKRWRDGQMALRWCAAGMRAAGKQFRRVNGHLHLKTLRAALDRHVAAENVGIDRHNDTVTAA